MVSFDAAGDSRNRRPQCVARNENRRCYVEVRHRRGPSGRAGRFTRVEDEDLDGVAADRRRRRRRRADHPIDDADAGRFVGLALAALQGWLGVSMSVDLSFDGAAEVEGTLSRCRPNTRPSTDATTPPKRRRRAARSGSATCASSTSITPSSVEAKRRSPWPKTTSPTRCSLTLVDRIPFDVDWCFVTFADDRGDEKVPEVPAA